MHRYAYVTVIQAENEPEARAYAERCLQPGAVSHHRASGGGCLMIGGGVEAQGGPREYRTGPVAAVVACAAYDGDGGLVETAARALRDAALGA